MKEDTEFRTNGRRKLRGSAGEPEFSWKKMPMCNVYVFGWAKTHYATSHPGQLSLLPGCK